MRNKIIVSLVIIICMIGFIGTAFAQNPFVSVPQNHWSYAAIMKLVNEEILDKSDSKFYGDRSLTRYEMAMVTAKAIANGEKANDEQKALINKLAAEYDDELKNLNSSPRLAALEKKADNVKIFGNVHLRWDSDKTDGKLNSTDGRHFYLNLDGSMKVNDNWNAHFQAENKNRYLSYQTSGDDINKFAERIWAEGSVGKANVTVGRKWWWLGQGLMFAHSMDGVKVDFPVASQANVSVFFMRPAEISGLTNSTTSTMGGNSTSYLSLGDYEKADLMGFVLSGNLSKTVNSSLMIGGNKHTVDSVTASDKYADVTSWGEVGFNAKLPKNFSFGTAYTRTNADNYNNSQRYSLNYKGADLNTPGSYGVSLSYMDLGRYGDLLHDDFWGYQWSDSKNWTLSVDYVLDKNLKWTTYYSDQKRNISGLGGYWNAIANDNASQNTHRKVFFTEVQFNY